MKRRLFTAINLPAEIKQKLAAEVDGLKSLFIKAGLDIRFLSPENWHLTIAFLGYQDDTDINLIINALQTITPKFTAPFVEFKKIIYGPPDKPPRMIWLTSSNKTSKLLAMIKDELEKELINQGVRFQQESRAFNAHLTLARFDLPRQLLPAIEWPFSEKFEAKSLDLMESHLKRTGAEYEILSAFDFKQ